MDFNGEIPVIYENGVFRPETPVDIPDRSRLRISIRDDLDRRDTPAMPLKETLERLRARGLVRANGWRPTRDELHERT